MDILSTGFLSALLAIVVIDLVLAGDNAIVIALAARSEIFNAFTRFEQKVADTRGLQTGSLHIAASTVSKYFMSRMLVEFAQAYPGIDVRMHVGHR